MRRSQAARRHSSLTPLARALAIGCILPLALCQCRCVKACVRFFKDHASTGHVSATPKRTAPSRSMRVHEFIAVNAHRGLSEDTLRSRFRVADLNSDGTLTPMEVEQHRARAAANKSRNDNGTPRRDAGGSVDRWIDGTLQR
jgi:hypothetical protein